MTVVALVGFVLQIVGLLLAINGLSDTYSTLLDSRSLWKDIRDRSWRWIKVNVLRRSVPHEVKAVAGTLGMSIEVSGAGALRRAAPGADAPIAEQIDYLRRTVDTLLNDTEQIRKQTRDDIKAAKVELRADLSKIAERVDTSDERVQRLERSFAGRNGSGLQQAVVGLLLTAIGTLLGAIATLPDL
ncbi:MAG TPA: hypothetical protein VNQ73_14075 [Ilumatobacter sp.]|nr:hypothetical protein [Ilumatobacter sp.]